MTLELNKLRTYSVRTWFATILMMLVGGFSVGCTTSEAPPPEEGVTDVVMQGIAFVPKEVTIVVGESVRWTNLDALIPHTTTSGDGPEDEDTGVVWDSGTMNSGDTFTRKFNEEGEFIYFCRFHPFIPAMRDAKVIVVANDSEGDAP